jgi:putative sigma-54 modulation protein
MYRQIVRYKGKRQRARKGGAVPEVIVPLDMDEMVDLEETPGEIVRVKRFSLVPMMQEEAIEQMELLGHSFFVFYNVDEDGVNVLYRRHDGNYGLIVPALD